MKKYEKLYPQLVEVVNELKAKIESSESNPVFVDFPSSFVAMSGNQSRLRISVGNFDQLPVLRPTAGNYHVQVSALYLQDSQTGFVTVVPLNQVYYNLTVAQISALEASFHSFNLLYPATSPAKVVYSTFSSSASVSQVVYSLQ